jgi:hypothetical protein
MSSIKNKLFQKLASLYFKIKGTYQLDLEDIKSFWKSEFQGSLLKLIQNNKTKEIGRSNDFQRIKSPADFQRLVPLDSGICVESNKYQTTATNEKARSHAITRIFELIAGWDSSPIFNSNWLIASNLYNPSICWSHLPGWLKCLSASPSEHFTPDWMGVYASADCLVSGSLDSLLRQRKESFPHKPAYILGEFGSEDIKSINVVASIDSEFFNFIPVWSDLSSIIAILDAKTKNMRFIANGDYYPELLVIQNDGLRKRIPFFEADKEMEGEIVLSMKGEYWARSTGVFVKVQDTDRLQFSFLNTKPKNQHIHPTTRGNDKKEKSRPVVPPHPQKAGISAALSKISSHNPW